MLAFFEGACLPSAAATTCRAKLVHKLEEEHQRLVQKNDLESSVFCQKQLQLLTNVLEDRVSSGQLADVKVEKVVSVSTNC